MTSSSATLRAAFEAQLPSSRTGDGSLAISSDLNYKDPEIQKAFIWFQRGWASHAQEIYKQIQHRAGLGDRRQPVSIGVAINIPPEPKV